MANIFEPEWVERDQPPLIGRGARFYNYADTFAFLLAAELVARSREPGFAERYERFLMAGGSASPEELMAVVGVDLGDPEIWNDGFAVLEGFIERMC